MKANFTDRYEASGIPYPDPATVCKGDCEGTGIVPLHIDDKDPKYKEMWAEAHKKECVGFLTRCDGWHFVVCPDCRGTGKEKDESGKA